MERKFVYGILVGLIVGVLCFGIYFFTRDVKEVSCNDESGKINTYSYNLSKRETVLKTAIDDDGNQYSFIIDLDGSVYFNVSGSSSFSKDINGKYSKYVLKGEVREYDSEDGYGLNGIDALKLDIDKVLYARTLFIGNGGIPYCIFILENGEVAYLNVYEFQLTGNPVITKVDGLSGVVSINGEGTKTYFVDINGNEIPSFEYIK